MKFPNWLPVFGDVSYRNKKCPPESVEQITVFNWLRANGYKTAIHPRNEGKRTYNQTSRQKAEGMTKGASDIIIPHRIPFICELKRQDHTLCKLEDEQIEYLKQCKKDGAFVCVALGYKSVLEAIAEWNNWKKQGKI